MAPILIWSKALVRKQANVEINGTVLPRVPQPIPTPTRFCSAMKHSMNRSGKASYVAFKTCEWCNIQHLDITLDDTISSIAITLTPFFLWEYECITITFKLRFKVLTKIFGYYFWKVFLILHNTFPLLYWYDSLCGQKHIPVDYKIFHFLQLSKF